MKKFFFFFLAFCFCGQSNAQVGLNFGYRQNISSEWPDMFNEIFDSREDFILKGGYKVGIDYWFKALKNTRLEMMPEVSFSSFSSDINDLRVTGGDIINVSSRILSLEWKTNIYPMDLDGDCNCPTFSKDGDVVQKGFFFQLAPGINYFINQMESRQLKQDNKSLAFSIAAGIGLDIGFSEFFTVTPVVKAYYLPAAKWNTDDLGVVSDSIEEKNTTNLLQFYAGMRIGLRFDELKRW